MGEVPRGFVQLQGLSLLGDETPASNIERGRGDEAVRGGPVVHMFFHYPLIIFVSFLAFHTHYTKLIPSTSVSIPTSAGLFGTVAKFTHAHNPLMTSGISIAKRQSKGEERMAALYTSIQ